VNNVLVTHDRPTIQNPAWPPEAVDLLTRAEQLLRESRPREALALLPAATDSTWLRNARGVCLLRLGRASQAVETLRDLVFERAGFAVRADADPVFQANYATALLLDGNAEGFWSILGGIRDRTSPAVARLDDAVRRWRAGMTLGQRIASAVGIGGPRFALDFPPGDL
jgi:hypothetical protein